MSSRDRSVAATVWLGLLALVLVTVMFAPVLTMGWCADADEGGQSICGSMQTSLLGMESNLWLWLGAMLIVLVATLLLLRRRRTEPS
ncbi:LPXTG cell wall anchor domain-containing protein [Microbacterium ureisolvens]|uniref:LPXTG cell wall anchor domain-containing protein n=1 Tax=Microbacterium ureisolvens TaxID=2781186 RepID=UPI00362A15AE